MTMNGLLFVIWTFNRRFAEESSRLGDIVYSQMTALKDWREKQKERENVSFKRECLREIDKM